MKTVEASEVNDIVEELYVESSDDIIGLWEVAKLVEELIGECDAVRPCSFTIVRALLAKGLLAGDPPFSSVGYAPWPDQNPDSIISRLDREWLALGQTPNIPDIAWFGRPQ